MTHRHVFIIRLNPKVISNDWNWISSYSISTFTNCSFFSVTWFEWWTISKTRLIFLSFPYKTAPKLSHMILFIVPCPVIKHLVMYATQTQWCLYNFGLWSLAKSYLGMYSDYITITGKMPCKYGPILALYLYRMESNHVNTVQKRVRIYMAFLLW